MNRTLTLRCFDDRRILEIDQVSALSATDASGQFGILPGHMPFLTLLLPGMISYRREAANRYLGTAGGMFCCRGDTVNIVSTRFVEAEKLSELMPALRAMQAAEGLERKGRQHQDMNLMQTFARRLKEWQEMK